MQVSVRAEVPDPLEMELQLAVRHQTWVRGTEFELAAQAVHALKY